MLRSISARLARTTVRSASSIAVAPSVVAASSTRSLLSSVVKPAFSFSPSLHSSIRTLSSTPLRFDQNNNDSLVDTEAPISVEEPFSQLQGKIDDSVMRALTQKPFNFTNMSAVQARVLKLLPGLIGGNQAAEEAGEPHSGKKDILVKARTGTGKTVAFLTPAIEARLHTLSQQDDPALYRFGHAGTLIITPTRELAIQIANEARALTSTQKERWGVHLFVGGESKGLQLREWQRSSKDIIVATPGRMLDLLNTQPTIAQAFKSMETLVLDEADTMLDMGFDRDLQAILRTLPSERQTFLFSATVSSAIRNIAKTFLQPGSLFIDVVPKGEAQTVDRIDQHGTVLTTMDELLPHIFRLIAHDQLIKPNGSKIILFCNTTKMTQLMSTLVRNMTSFFPAGRATKVYNIHSKLDSKDRTRTSAAFRGEKSRASILVTSDVSARGVDYPGTSRVIQFGISGDAEQYTHRVGRTGRGGADGRGDIVLAPFEAEFLTKELGKFPVKPLSTVAFKEEVAHLATVDPSSEGQAGHTLAKLREIDQGVKDIQARLSPDVLSDVFGSLMGFYAKMDQKLAIKPMDVVRGIQEMGSDAFGMDPPPSFSANYLLKIGIKVNGPGGGSYGARVRASDIRRDVRGHGGHYYGQDRGRSNYGNGEESYGGERSRYGGGKASYGGGGSRGGYGGGRGEGRSQSGGDRW